MCVCGGLNRMNLHRNCMVAYFWCADYFDRRAGPESKQARDQLPSEHLNYDSLGAQQLHSFIIHCDDSRSTDVL